MFYTVCTHKIVTSIYIAPAAAIVELPNVVDLVKTQSVATLEQEHVGWVVL